MLLLLLLQFLLYILVCFCGFAAAGVLGVFISIDWWDVTAAVFSGDAISTVINLLGTLSITDLGEVENIRNCVTATAVSPIAVW